MLHVAKIAKQLVALWLEVRGESGDRTRAPVADASAVIRDVRCSPATTSFVLTFAGTGPGDGLQPGGHTGIWQVSVGRNPPAMLDAQAFLALEEPDAVYFLTGDRGRFLLDTASAPRFGGLPGRLMEIFARPLAKIMARPARLDPGTTYHFVITAPVRTVSGYAQYAGTCTTLEQPRERA